MSKRRDNWLDEDEYPDERDTAALGEDSPTDYDRSTVGRVGGMRQPYWTKTRIFLAAAAALILFSLLLAEIGPLLSR